jgi:UDP-glucose 4-epimerase
MAGEWYHILYHNVYSLRATALRLTNTYGPRMRIRDARQTFLGVWLRLIVQEEPFEVWEGRQLRDFTFVDDAVEAMLLAAASERANGRVFNLGGERAVNLKELADLLIAANGGRGRYEVRPFPANRKRVDIGDYYADYSCISTTLGWEPRVHLEEGLTLTLDFFRRYLDNYL